MRKPALKKASSTEHATGDHSRASLRITGILEMVKTDFLPFAGDTVMNVINFRGKTVPVIDLRVNPAKAFNDFGAQLCVMSVENGQPNAMVLCALVDSEKDAYELIAGKTH